MLISGTVVNDNKGARFALSSLYGINKTRSRKLCAHLGFRPDVKLRNLAGMQALSKTTRDYAPRDLAKNHRDRIKFYVNLKHYKGLRHMFGLPCRGQRTRTNARTARRRNSGPRAMPKRG